MHIFVDNNTLIIVVMNDGQLEFCNIFPYHTSNDLIYFVLFVLDEILGVEKENCPVHLYGNIDSQSEIYQLIRTYISQVSLLNEPS